MATTRVIAQSGISEKLLSAVKDIVMTFKAGDVDKDQSVKLGALFNEASAVNAVNMLKDARAKGAEILLGDLTNNGAVIQPHLIGNVKPGTPLWDREVFGPGIYDDCNILLSLCQCLNSLPDLVIVFAAVETVDEAVDLANASDYSLAASIWSADQYAAQRTAARIHSGIHNWYHVQGLKDSD